jgi:hypothetical protein
MASQQAKLDVIWAIIGVDRKREFQRASLEDRKSKSMNPEFSRTLPE